MRGIYGWFDLIMIMALMIASVPLMMTMVITMNKTKMEYLEDKTIYTMPAEIEYEEKIVNGQKVVIPKTLATVQLDYGGTQALACVQDDYCPTDGRVVRYNYDASSVYDGSDPSDGELTIVKGWRASMKNHWKSQLQKSLNLNYKDKNLYLVWSAKDRNWMFSYNDGHLINIYEVG